MPQKPEAQNIFYVNGDFVPEEKACLPVVDLAVLRGYAIFEAVRTYNGKPFELEGHLERLRSSAERICLALPWTTRELAQLVMETLAKNSPGEKAIRIMITGGGSPDFLTPANRPGLIVMITPLHPFPASLYQTGCRVKTAPIERFWPEAKTIHYIPGLVTLQEAKKDDSQIVEILHVDRDRRITEGIVSNLFAVSDSALITPGDRILYGITRRVIIDLAAKIMEVRQQDLLLQDLLDADEVFLASTTKEVMPVTQIDDRVIGNGKPGPRTRDIHRAFQEYAASIS